jgi:hypothetical protein
LGRTQADRDRRFQRSALTEASGRGGLGGFAAAPVFGDFGNIPLAEVEIIKTKSGKRPSIVAGTQARLLDARCLKSF